MGRWLLGSALVGVGLAWLIVNRWLVVTYPSQWGGPNIGGGALILLALAAVIGGIVLLIVGWPSSPIPVRIVGSAVDGLLAIGLVIIYATTHGDSTSTDINGFIALGVNAAGEPVLHLQICHGTVNTVTVYGPNRGSQPNEELATLTTATPVSGSIAIDFGAPPAGWSGVTSTTLHQQAATQVLLIASASGHNSELREFDFNAANLQSLTPATVEYGYYQDGGDFVSKRGSVADFSTTVCADGG